jgi:hypothetical protein
METHFIGYTTHPGIVETKGAWTSPATTLHVGLSKEKTPLKMR